MPYRFKRREPVADGLRRIAAEQLARAASALDHPADPPDAVHEARVRIKRTRAVLAMARHAMGRAAGRESDALRAIAHTLAPVRDAASMVQAFAGLRERFGGLDPASFAHIHAVLQRQAEHAAPVPPDSQSHAPPDEPPDEPPGTPATAPARTMLAARADLLDAADRAARWTIDAEGFDAIRAGLRSSYARARKGRRDAIASEDPACRHAWRIRVRRLAEQVRLLRPLWPEVFDAHAADLRRVQSFLGLDHDMALLSSKLRAGPDDFGEPRAVLAVARLADRAGRHAMIDLQRPAHRALSERPAAFVARVESLWNAWRGKRHRGL